MLFLLAKSAKQQLPAASSSPSVCPFVSASKRMIQFASHWRQFALWWFMCAGLERRLADCVFECFLLSAAVFWLGSSVSTVSVSLFVLSSCWWCLKITIAATVWGTVLQCFPFGWLYFFTFLVGLVVCYRSLLSIGQSVRSSYEQLGQLHPLLTRGDVTSSSSIVTNAGQMITSSLSPHAIFVHECPLPPRGQRTEVSQSFKKRQRRHR